MCASRHTLQRTDASASIRIKAFKDLYAYDKEFVGDYTMIKSRKSVNQHSKLNHVTVPIKCMDTADNIGKYRDESCDLNKRGQEL